MVRAAEDVELADDCLARGRASSPWRAVCSWSSPAAWTVGDRQRSPSATERRAAVGRARLIRRSQRRAPQGRPPRPTVPTPSVASGLQRADAMPLQPGIRALVVPVLDQDGLGVGRALDVVLFSDRAATADDRDLRGADLVGKIPEWSSRPLSGIAFGEQHGRTQARMGLSVTVWSVRAGDPSAPRRQ